MRGGRSRKAGQGAGAQASRRPQTCAVARVHQADAAAPHPQPIASCHFFALKSQDIVTAGRNHPALGMIGEKEPRHIASRQLQPHWRTKCRKLSSLLLCSPSSPPAPRRPSRSLRPSRPNRPTPASTSDLIRGRGVAAAPGLSSVAQALRHGDRRPSLCASQWLPSAARTCELVRQEGRTC